METTLKDNVLTIKVPITEGKRSHSGKSILVFTTKGFVSVPNSDLRISINVIGKKIT